MNLTPYFLKGIAANDNYQEALEIARKNSAGGNIWVIGGTVFRTIIGELYERKGNDNYDYDFILEMPVESEKFDIPAGWELKRTGASGAPRLVRGLLQIDLVPLDHAVNPWESLTLRGNSFSEKLESYFRRVPLNIQAIAFDVVGNAVVGNLGIEAVGQKRIEVNNLDECLAFCKRRKISVREFIGRKRDALGFEAVFPVFSDSDKRLTTQYYNTNAGQYSKDRGDTGFISKYIPREVDRFVSELPGKRLLDLGSGPGHHSLYFKGRGLEPLCVDASAAMIGICREQGLDAIQMDIENLDFEKGSFDGVWAYASLLHIPKKRIFNTLARIHEVLKPRGKFFVSIAEGSGETLHESKGSPDQKRFFALYQHEEFDEMLEGYFKLLLHKRIEIPGKNHREVYLNYLCEKI